MGYPTKISTAHHSDSAVATAGTAKDQYVGHGMRGKFTPVKARFMPDTTAAADATNYATIALKDRAGSPATLGSITSASTALTAGTQRELTLTGNTTSAECDEDEFLLWSTTKAGTGAVVNGTLYVEWERVPGDTF